MKIIRRYVPILMIVLSALSCRKEAETRATFRVVNETGYTIDTLDVYCQYENPYCFRYYNLSDHAITNNETILNGYCVVYFNLRFNHKTWIAHCNTNGQIDPAGTIEDGEYVFYIICTDTVNQAITVAFQRERH